VDNTDGKERIHVYHPSNSYIEINHEGSIIIRNAKDKFEIVDENKKVHVMGAQDSTIDKDKTSYVKQTQYEKIDINKKEVVGGHKDVKIGTGEVKKLGGDQYVNAPMIYLNCGAPAPDVP